MKKVRARTGITMVLAVAFLCLSAAPSVAQDSAEGRMPFSNPSAVGLQSSSLLLDTASPFPWSVPAGALLLGTGVSPFFSNTMYRQNLLIREQMQLWRQERWNFRSLPVDNVLQFLPTAVTMGMYWSGVPSRHQGWAFYRRATGAFLFYAVTTVSLKYGFPNMRPDQSGTTSFPSGHTTIAFLGAELFRLEYGSDYPWLSVALYATAATTGALRIYNDRHWARDVLAGAGIGILSVQLSHWLNRWLFE